MTFSPIDFAAIRAGKSNVQEVADTFTLDDLRHAVEFSIHTMLAHIASCTDADVSFMSLDPETREELRDANSERLGWNLSHVIVHATATGEASAFAALDLARGISLQGVSRYEVPWTTLTTIEQCRQRLNESLRMRFATLSAWPDQPHLANLYTPYPGAGNLNAKGLFILGLEHDDVHQQHLAKIVQQIP